MVKQPVRTFLNGGSVTTTTQSPFSARPNRFVIHAPCGQKSARLNVTDNRAQPQDCSAAVSDAFEPDEPGGGEAVSRTPPSGDAGGDRIWLCIGLGTCPTDRASRGSPSGARASWFPR